MKHKFTKLIAILIIITLTWQDVIGICPNELYLEYLVLHKINKHLLRAQAFAERGNRRGAIRYGEDNAKTDFDYEELFASLPGEAEPRIFSKKEKLLKILKDTILFTVPLALLLGATYAVQKYLLSLTDRLVVGVDSEELLLEAEAYFAPLKNNFRYGIHFVIGSVQGVPSIHYKSIFNILYFLITAPLLTAAYFISRAHIRYVTGNRIVETMNKLGFTMIAYGLILNFVEIMRFHGMFNYIPLIIWVASIGDVMIIVGVITSFITLWLFIKEKRSNPLIQELRYIEGELRSNAEDMPQEKTEDASQETTRPKAEQLKPDPQIVLPVASLDEFNSLFQRSTDGENTVFRSVGNIRDKLGMQFRKIKGKDVAVFGCGAGTECFRAALEGAHRVVGIDLDKNSIIAARTLAPFIEEPLLRANLMLDVTPLMEMEAATEVVRRALSGETNRLVMRDSNNVEFMVGDVRDLSSTRGRQIEDNAFDIVVIPGILANINGVMNKEDMRRTIQEAMRITKPGGIISINWLEHIDIRKIEELGCQVSGLKEEERAFKELQAVVNELMNYAGVGGKRLERISSHGDISVFEVREILPAGSISNIFDYLCKNNITNPDIALSGQEIRARLGCSYETIKYDIRALYYHLHLFEKAEGTGREARFFVPEAVKKRSDQILPILARFRGKDLRPNISHLEEIYQKHIKPILIEVSPSDTSQAHIKEWQFGPPMLVLEPLDKAAREGVEERITTLEKMLKDRRASARAISMLNEPLFFLFTIVGLKPLTRQEVVKDKDLPFIGVWRDLIAEYYSGRLRLVPFVTKGPIPSVMPIKPSFFIYDVERLRKVISDNKDLFDDQELNLAQTQEGLDLLISRICSDLEREDSRQGLFYGYSRRDVLDFRRYLEIQERLEKGEITEEELSPEDRAFLAECDRIAEEQKKKSSRSEPWPGKEGYKEAAKMLMANETIRRRFKKTLSREVGTDIYMLKELLNIRPGMTQEELAEVLFKATSDTLPAGFAMYENNDTRMAAFFRMYPEASPIQELPLEVVAYEEIETLIKKIAGETTGMVPQPAPPPMPNSRPFMADPSLAEDLSLQSILRPVALEERETEEEKDHLEKGIKVKIGNEVLAISISTFCSRKNLERLRKVEIEDGFLFCPIKTTKSKGILMSVFDGHAGAEVMKGLRREFADIFSKRLNTNNGDETKALVQTIRYLAGQYNFDIAGSVVSAIYITEKEGEKIAYAAVVGDAPIFWETKDGHVKASSCHNLYNPDERKRVKQECEKLGYEISFTENAMVLRKEGKEIKLPFATITRAIGDANALARCSEPDIMEIRDFRVLVLGTDGVINYPAESYGQKILQLLSLARDGKGAASLVEWASRHGSRDEITVMVVERGKNIGKELKAHQNGVALMESSI